MQRLLLRHRSQRFIKPYPSVTPLFTHKYPSCQNVYYHAHNLSFCTQSKDQSALTSTPEPIAPNDDKKEEPNAEPTDKEETDEEKNKSFKRRWSVYILGALTTGFIYKICKSPQKYAALPQDISEQPLTIRSYLFSNILANRALSRICAPWTEKTIPIKWRKRIYSAVGWFWHVDWNEFKPNLEHYPTFKSFFIRPLEYHRTLATNDMISPSDGRVLTFGEIDRNNGTLEQIKGVTFKLKHFLYGYDSTDIHPNMLNTDENSSNGNKLYYAIIYLCPGDYHRFHACANNIKIDCVNHIVGDLYAVKPSWLRKIPGLFTLNERIVMTGKWRDDLFFAYVPVGAFNVGTIHLNCDEMIQTNQKRHDADVWYKNNGQNRNRKNDKSLDYTPYERVMGEQTPFVKKYVQYFDQGEELVYNKGDEVGYFAFGSTVVLIFEAPNFRFKVKPDQKIKYGDSLGDIVYDK